MDSLILQHIFVFFCMIITDICWAQYTSAVAKGRIWIGSTFSAGILAFGAFVTLSYVQDKQFLITAMAGAFVGTYLSILWDKTQEKK